MMRSNADCSSTSDLCYLDASKVESPLGLLSEVQLLNPDGKPLGKIEGVVIDAAERRLRYFDVRSGGALRRRRYLLEASQLALVDPEQKALRLRSGCRVEEVQDVNPAVLRRFSDDDLLAALFPRRAA